MKLQGKYLFDCGVEIIDPEFEITEIRTHLELKVCYVDVRLSVDNCTFVTSFNSFTFEGETYNEDEVLEWVLEKIENYKNEN